jgi:hypothetical protein
MAVQLKTGILRDQAYDLQYRQLESVVAAFNYETNILLKNFRLRR